MQSLAGLGTARCGRAWVSVPGKWRSSANFLIAVPNLPGPTLRGLVFHRLVPPDSLRLAWGHPPC
jgi:hypothetical protein